MRRVLPIAGVAVLMLTGCTGTTRGNPRPSSESPGQTATPDTADQVPGPGVPKVETPVDLTRFRQFPCEALSESQAGELIGPEVQTRPDLESPAGPACSWNPPDASRPLVRVIFDRAATAGLTSFYKDKSVKYALFTPLQPINGYPVVAYGVYDARDTEGVCSVAVGTSDQEVFDVGLTLSQANVGKKDPCDVAREGAIRALTTIRGTS
ncbi:DUF3558 domain-containing protein [Amycolatopsis sp. NBC_01307]|uniref:DUF3558 domain-containing protein n=1 Tax=Amycolatopsis sp. NBC_01307 TaxID=2903561 RepID=UPI002E133A90|nr:DUF3558 domain-containing protein [Amycolatopsis sp. NBC_01307]